MHILHIEDDSSVQVLVQRLLGRAFPGCEITAVASAKLAISALAAIEFTLVISDFDVLDGTGADVLNWLRANRLNQRFMFFSGNEAIADFGAPFLLKPAGRAELASAVLGALA